MPVPCTHAQRQGGSFLSGVPVPGGALPMLSPVQGGGQRELLVLLSPSELLGSCFGGSQASNKCRSHTVDHALFLFTQQPGFNW